MKTTKNFILAKDVKENDVIFFNNSNKKIIRAIDYICNNENYILLSYIDNRKFNKIGHKRFEPLNRLIIINNQ
jgi:hypothetical protein